MNTHRTMVLIALAALAGCSDPGFEDYYANGGLGGPRINAVEPGFEAGNLGGQQIVIEGSDFGTDPLVLIGNHNVQVIEATDDAITVQTPVGPITGGKVSVLVANEHGYDEFGRGPTGDDPDEDGYVYDMSVVTGPDRDTYAGQNSYILVQNFWNSCLGGRSPVSIPGAGCEGVAYIGQSGIEGSAEFFRFVYPRVHTASMGFLTGFDATPEWTVLAGAEAATPFPSGIDDLKRRLATDSINPNDINSFKLVNDALSDIDDQCLIIDGGDVQLDSSCGPDSMDYRVDEMLFCEGEDASNGPDFTYVADYPVLQDFFVGQDGPGSMATVEVESDDDLLNGLLLTFPPPLDVDGVAGMGVGDDLWIVTGELDACPDTDGDGQALLDEAGIVVEWEPIAEPDRLGGECRRPGDCEVSVSNYVHVSVTLLNVGWFGGEGAGMRASVVVPDTDGRVEIPNEVLLQFPSPNLQWSNFNELTSSGTLGTWESNAGYIILEFTRVTDYRIENLESGDVTVFAYATGDLSFVDWQNPVEAAEDCFDCLDGDGDGYADARDPDCNEDLGGNGATEDDTNTDFTCSDGIDNDLDGNIDADDDKCINGWDAENTCGDGIDNDGDGWVDGADGECAPDDPFANESGSDDASWLCSDGLDNDGDGWFDAEDPGCADGTGTSEGGFDSTLPCNDGLEDPGDVDELADADDPYCRIVGARDATAEYPDQFFNQCINGTDDDSDVFADLYDPDCEYGFAAQENFDFFDATDDTAAWFGHYIPACYNGLDDDLDGAIDGADPGCWLASNGFFGSGWIEDEATVHQFPSGHPDAGTDTPCSDGVDSDGDGWIDGLDPDCNPGEATGDGQKELGFGTSLCNDGIDNNDDGLIDSESTTWCKDGRGTFEGP